MQDETEGQPRRRRPGRRRFGRRRIIGTAVIGVLGSALIVSGLLVWRQYTSDDEQIHRAATVFAVAVQSENSVRIAGLLCQEEAQEYKDGDGYDPTDTDVAKPEVVFTTRPAIPMADIRIVGDAASAQVLPRPQHPATLYFRKENGVWKPCAPAVAQLPADDRH